jgi:hypothetical protein
MSIQVFGIRLYVAGLIFPNFLKEHVAFVFKGWWSALEERGDTFL